MSSHSSRRLGLVGRSAGLFASILGTASLLAACASSGTGQPAPAKPVVSGAPTDYYPLTPGWKWAYDLDKNGSPILAVYAVLERTADGAVIQAGDDQLTYAITPEGIAQREGAAVGDYILKRPLTVGATWPVSGGTAKITAIDKSVTVVAGPFTGCIEVEVTRNDPLRIARTIFAPGVGPVLIELQVESGAGFVTDTRAALRAVTKPGQDPLGG